MTEPEPTTPPEELQPVTVTEVDEPGPEAPEETETHGEQDEDAG